MYVHFFQLLKWYSRNVTNVSESCRSYEIYRIFVNNSSSCKARSAASSNHILGASASSSSPAACPAFTTFFSTGDYNPYAYQHRRSSFNSSNIRALHGCSKPTCDTKMSGCSLQIPSQYNGIPLDEIDKQFYNYLFDDNSVLTVYRMRMKTLEPEVEEKCLLIGNSKTPEFEASLTWKLLDGTIISGKANDKAKKAARKTAARKVLVQLPPLSLEEFKQTTLWACNNFKYVTNTKERKELRKQGNAYHQIVWWTVPVGKAEVEVEGIGSGETEESASFAAIRSAFVKAHVVTGNGVCSSVGKGEIAKTIVEVKPNKDTSHLLKSEAAQINTRFSHLAQLHEAQLIEDISQEGTLFRCLLKWKPKFYDSQKECLGNGLATSKAVARAEARLQVMVALGVEEPIDEHDREKAANIKKLIDEGQFSEAVCCAVLQFQRSTEDTSYNPGVASWALFLFLLFDRLLQQGETRLAHLLIDGLIKATADRSQQKNLLPFKMWEELLESCLDKMDYKLCGALLYKLGRVNISDRSFLSASSKSYYFRFRHLLALERHAELSQSINKIFQNIKVSRKFIAMDIVNLYLPLIQFKAKLKRHEFDLLLDSRTREGDWVLLVPAESNDCKYEQDKCTIAAITFMGKDFSSFQITMRILSQKTNENLNYQEGKSLRAYLLSPHITYKRTIKALHAFVTSDPIKKQHRYHPAIQFIITRAYDNRAQEVAKGGLVPQIYDWDTTSMNGKDVLLDSKTAADPSPHVMHSGVFGQGIYSEASRNDRQKLLVISTELVLSDAQVAACFSAIVNRVTIVQGPPGTGKTYLASAIIKLWNEIHFHSKILAVADSNVAADNLYYGLEALNVPSFRVGMGSWLDVEEMKRADIRRYKAYVKMRELEEHKEAVALRMEFCHDMIKRSGIIITTCIGAGHELLEDETFDRVLIDECAQSIEPCNLIPLSKGCKSLVLIGDHKQLPPTILSLPAADGGLNVSLLERLVSSNVAPVHILDKQRRMHPSIAEFPSLHFYNGLVASADVGDYNRPVIEGFPWPSPSHRVCFVNTFDRFGTHYESNQSSSKYNSRESMLILSTLWSILSRKGVKPLEVGILTPYDAQKCMIQNTIREFFDESVSNKVEVNSVDGFQGREKDLILFSAVRANRENSVGFLKDGRRLNVMLTRARRGLIVFGDRETLSSERHHWKPWLDWAVSHNLVINAEMLGNPPQSPLFLNGAEATNTPDAIDWDTSPTQAHLLTWLCTDYAGKTSTSRHTTEECSIDDAPYSFKRQKTQ